MKIKPISPDSVGFNPSTNMFEALVTVQTERGSFRYPCAVEGSLKTPCSIAVFKLALQAKRRHQNSNDLRACTARAVDVMESLEAA